MIIKTIAVAIVLMFATSCGKNSSQNQNLKDEVKPVGNENSYHGKIIFEMLDDRVFPKSYYSDKISIDVIESNKVVSNHDFSTNKLQKGTPATIKVAIQKNGPRNLYIGWQGSAVGGSYPLLEKAQINADNFEYKIKLKRIDIHPLKIKHENGDEELAEKTFFKIVAVDAKFWDDYKNVVKMSDKVIAAGDFLEKEPLGVDVVHGLEYEVYVWGYSKGGDFVNYSTILDFTK